MSGTPQRFNRGRSGEVLGLAAGLLLLSMSQATAASISGRIEGRHGLLLDGPVAITATNLATGRQATVTAREDGLFTIPDFPDGRAVLVVSGGESSNGPLQTRMVNVPAAGIRDVVLATEPPAMAPTFNFLLYKGEYYNNQPTEQLANNVAVTAPTPATTGINFALAAGGGSISGRVMNAAGTTGLPGLLVFALGQESGIISFDRTDATGNYKITGIPADSFLVTVNLFLLFEESDYVGEYYNNASSFFDYDPVGVVDGADTPNINFNLDLGGTLTGRVTADNGGAGIPNAEVSLSLPPPLFGGASTITDASGNYSFRGLRASTEYKVHADAEGFVSEYYLNQPTQVLGTPVTITSGGTTSNINLSLATGGTIEGTVRREGTNDPLPDLFVLAQNTVTADAYYGNTDENGHYSVGSLPAASYHVSVPEIGKWWNDATAEVDADPVDVPAGVTVSNINFVGVPSILGCNLDPSSRGHISGRVTREVGGTGVEDADVSVWLDLGGFGRFQFDLTQTDVNGDYSFDCLDAGNYFVRVQPSNTNLLPEWYNNADSAGAAQIAIPEGGGRSDIHFALAAGGSISGKVTIEGTSTPLSFVVVTAKNVATGETFETFTNATGDYTLDNGSDGGLRSGNYKVWAASRSTADLSLVPVILSRLEAYDTEDGIAVEWAIEGDEAVSGIHVYRSDNAGSEPARLTPNPLRGDQVRFVDATAVSGVDVSYWIGIIDRDGREERFGPVSARRGEAPLLTQLLGPRPNPARESAAIAFTLARPARVTLRIHDLSGRLVRTLVDAEKPAGAGQVTWDARRDDGRPASRGMYYVRFTAGSVVETEKLILTR